MTFAEQAISHFPWFIKDQCLYDTIRKLPGYIDCSLDYIDHLDGHWNIEFNIRFNDDSALEVKYYDDCLIKHEVYNEC